MSVEIVADRELIASRVQAIADDLNDRISDETPLVVGVLKGAMPFLADLTKAMAADLEVDMFGLTRFGEGGKVSLAIDVGTPLEDRHVVLVEDLVDTGLTLRSVWSMLEARSPASITVVTLLDRRARRLVEVPVDHAAFVVGDEFVIGYGLDWEGRYRNLQDLWGVLDLTEFAAAPPALEQV